VSLFDRSKSKNRADVQVVEFAEPESGLPSEFVKVLDERASDKRASFEAFCIRNPGAACGRVPAGDKDGFSTWYGKIAAHPPVCTAKIRPLETRRRAEGQVGHQGDVADAGNARDRLKAVQAPL
jgi:hypothetical protein